MADKVRIDKYLWAIRIFKTRSIAADACEQGRVKFMGASVKAARSVTVGDEYEVRADGRKWVIKVVALLDKRLKYTEAVNYYIDNTPAEELERLKYEAAAFYTGKRISKIGRPTKKDRRDLEDFTSSE